MSVAAALRHRLAHQTTVDVSDGVGGITRTFITVDMLWGSVEVVSTEFGLGEERPRAAQVMRITVRAPNTVVVGDRLLLGARVFHVEATGDADGRGRLTRCRCREEQP
ncbi:head-tail adaptor protein [Xanthobacter sediminis]|uniref:head-tail adaptor protein n=1 Tax=Xanthobacter sediminis TaxID=3119926 RepID=UPI00372BEE20